eukprot:COSAG01_NODE_6764_length_3509_cov_25.877419_2_plen_197_part_00
MAGGAAAPSTELPRLVGWAAVRMAGQLGGAWDPGHGQADRPPASLASGGGEALTGGRVSRPFSSWNRPILTEIYLCHACSCQETLRVKTAGQVHRRALGCAHATDERPAKIAGGHGSMRPSPALGSSIEGGTYVNQHKTTYLNLLLPEATCSCGAYCHAAGQWLGPPLTCLDRLAECARTARTSGCFNTSSLNSGG